MKVKMFEIITERTVNEDIEQACERAYRNEEHRKARRQRRKAERAAKLFLQQN